jgi:hypothetical protein
MESVDPERERQRLLELYSEMDEGQLDELAGQWDSLTDAAREALKQEVERRGLYIEFEEGRKAQEPPESNEFVTIGEFGSRSEAAIAQGLLETAGIKSDIAGTLKILGYPTPDIDPFPVRLRVKEEDAETAIAILEAAASADPEPEA